MVEQDKSNRLGITSLVLGIISIISFWTLYLKIISIISFWTLVIGLIGILTGIVGIVYSIKQRRIRPNGIATAGLVTSILGTTFVGLFYSGLFSLIIYLISGLIQEFS